MRRVVITGLGVVSTLGRGVEHNWKRLLNSESGVVKITDIDLKDIPVQIAGRVPYGTGEGQFNPDDVLPPKDQKKNDKFVTIIEPHTKFGYTVFRERIAVQRRMAV